MYTDVPALFRETNLAAFPLLSSYFFPLNNDPSMTPKVYPRTSHKEEGIYESVPTSRSRARVL